MRRSNSLPLLFLPLLALAWAEPARANDDQVVRTFTKNFPAAGLRSVSLDVAVGEVEVVAADVPEVQVDLKVLCSRRGLKSCTQRAQHVTFSAARSEERISVKARRTSGWGNLHIKAVITAPRSLGVNADLSVGELHIDGFEGNVVADLGVGEVHVSAPESAFRSVSVDTGVGEGHLIAAGRHWSSEGLFTREIVWNEGKGASRISIDCGVGEAHVRLDRGEKVAANR